MVNRKIRMMRIFLRREGLCLLIDDKEGPVSCFISNSVNIFCQRIITHYTEKCFLQQARYFYDSLLNSVKSVIENASGQTIGLLGWKLTSVY